MKKIYFAGGCFWGVQAFFKMLKGVNKTFVGYANSNVKDPLYSQVKSQITNAVETVEVSYDENITNLDLLIEKFFSVIDPTALNFQGPDYGSQYRSGIYYTDADDELIIKNKVSQLAKNIKGKVATEILPLENFYIAEDYHQNYIDKHPQTICHIKLK